MTAFGCDHAGYLLKKEIEAHFIANGLDFEDYGCFGTEPADYPIYAKLVCEAVLDGSCERGILICNTGIGLSMAANRFRGIRAALCHDETTARAARDHNNANVLVLGSKVVGSALALEIVKIFLSADFSNAEKHIRRTKMLDDF